MTESKRKTILGLTLIAAIIWGYLNKPWKGGGATPAPATEVHQTPQPTTTPAAVKQVARSLAASHELIELRKRPWGADPFYHPDEQPRRATNLAAAKQNYRLQAILYNETSPSAYVNNQVVRVGDEIDNATVLKITKKSVTLKSGTKTFSIKVSRG